MCLGTVAPDDEGYSTLMPDPPSLEQIQDRFRALRATYETAAARLRAPEMRTNNPESP